MKLKKEDILIRFEEYNKKYFDGVLPPCKCHVIREKEHTLLVFIILLKEEVNSLVIYGLLQMWIGMKKIYVR